MSTIPIMLNDVLDELPARPPSLFHRNFGLALLADDLANLRSPTRMPASGGHRGPRRRVRGSVDGASNIAGTDNEFKVDLDVRQFNRENLKAKVVGNSVAIEGKHEERRDEHGGISGRFCGRHVPPRNVDPDTVASSLSSDGVLTITAPKKTPPLPQNERLPPVVRTRRPASRGRRRRKRKETPRRWSGKRSG